MTSHGGHLTESEFVDLFDGTLAAVRRQHVESCAACAAQAADIATDAHDVRQVDVPEPPPFFWTQFSARVSEAVSNEAARPGIVRFWWAFALSEAAPGRRARASWFAAAAGIAVGVLVVVVALRNTPEDASVAAPVAADPRRQERTSLRTAWPMTPSISSRTKRGRSYARWPRIWTTNR